MTAHTHDFLRHTMQLTAESNTLTGCKWLVQDSGTVAGSSSNEEMNLIEMAIDQISEYLEGKRKDFNVPLRLNGSDFKIKVWKELCKIPYGKTITYKELAERIESPNACRAVANACGANPFPIIIPCHRVIASGGKSGGYTGGLDIKLALLDLENQNADKFVV